MTDSCRTFTIPAESRTYTIETLTGGTILITASSSGYWGGSYWGGSYWGGLYWTAIAGTVTVTASPSERVFAIEAESRTKVIAAENRTLTIEAENRTLTIEC